MPPTAPAAKRTTTKPRRKSLANRRTAWQCPHEECRIWNDDHREACSGCHRQPNGESLVAESKPVADIAGVELDLPVDSIEQSTFNPRIEFDGTELDELAESLQKHGQLQNLVVYRDTDCHRLIAGERRWRAAKLAGIPTLRCRVLSVTRAQAAEMAGEENLRRVDLSAIEVARWYRTMLDEAGWTQEQLGERVGVEQSTISNRLRLLRLPDVWQRRIIRREIPETHARQLVKWCDVEVVLIEVEGFLAERYGEKGGTFQIPALKDWDSLIWRAASAVSMPVKPANYFNVRRGREWVNGSVAWTKKELDQHRDELQIRKLGSEERAFNVTRWWELQDQYAKAREEREARRSTKSKGSADPLTPGEQRKKAEQAKEQRQTRLGRYLARWYQARLLERTDSLDSDQLTRLAIAVIAAEKYCAGDICEAVGRSAGGIGGETRAGAAWAAIKDLDADAHAAALRDVARKLIAVDVKSWASPLHPEDHESICRSLGITLDDWRVDAEYLAILTKDEIAALAKSARIAVDGTSKSDYVAAVLAQPSRIDLPKELAKAKPCR